MYLQLTEVNPHNSAGKQLHWVREAWGKGGERKYKMLALKW